MDPVTGLAIGSAVVSGLGSMFGAKAQASAAKKQLEEQRRQFELQQKLQREQMGQQDRQFGQSSNLDRSKYLDQRGVDAAALQRRINLNPLADQAAYGMKNMLGASPAPFQPRDFTRATMPGAGQASGGASPMLAAQAKAMEAYKPGAGGMDPAELIAARDRLQSLAGVPAEYTTPAPPPPPYYGGGGGGGMSDEERMLMARFTPYML